MSKGRNFCLKIISTLFSSLQTSYENIMEQYLTIIAVGCYFEIILEIPYNQLHI